MDINKTNEQMENTESNNLNENCKELWIFQYDTEINLDQKYFEKLTGK